jgi:2-isopropylmalate synthase
MTVDSTSLIYDWNTAASLEPGPGRGKIELNDETLRDGLQSPSVRDPSLEQKIAILHKMSDLQIESANIGLPGAGPHVVDSVRRLAREIVEQNLGIMPNCAARTLARDIEPILQISQDTGLEIEVACFLGSSAIRRYTENWEMDRLLELAESAVSLAVEHACGSDTSLRGRYRRPCNSEGGAGSGWFH